MGLVPAKAAGKGILWAFVGLSGALVSTGAVAQPPLPEGVPGERARAMVAILTGPANDAAAIEPIVAANWAASALAQRPAAERAKALAGVRVDLGAAELVRIERPNENELELIFRSQAKGLWLTVGMRLEPRSPGGILSASMQLDSNPPRDAAATAGPKLAPEQAIQQAAARIDELAEEGAFSGVVLIARDGAVQLETAAGRSDRERGVLNAAATRFNIGSISKSFTEVLIAQLAAEGRLTLDDRLIRHLPDYPDRAIAGQVTLRQLLAHRSGMGDVFNERFTPEAAAGLRTLQDYLPLFTGKPLEFEPGTAQRYSNAGYVVLGLVVERLTGKAFADAARERIFIPAAMAASGWLPRDALPADAAIGYTREGWQEERQGPARPGETGKSLPPPGAPKAPPPPGSPKAPPAPRLANSLALPAIGSSAGGSYSTARDLFAFARALAEGRLRGPERFAQQGGMAVAGGTAGANAVLEADFQPGGWTVIVLENLDPPAAEGLARDLKALLDRVERAQPAAGATGPAD